MELFLYAMTFPPIVLIALIVHEAGHMVTARLLGIRVMAFQIGMGPKIATIYTGKTRVRLNATQDNPEPGAVIHYWAGDAPDPEVAASAIVWQPALMAIKRPKRTKHTPAEKQLIDEAFNFNQNHPRFTGRVKNVEGDVMTIADTTWALAWIPIMASVHVAEHPKDTGVGYFNTASWPKQMAVIFAGVAANLLLLHIVIMALTVAPIGSAGQEVIVVQEIEKGSPADHAGVIPTDVVIRAGSSILPSPADMQRQVSDAASSGASLLLTVSRNGEPINKYLAIPPGRDTIGIGYVMGTIADQHKSTVVKRFLSLGETYFLSLGYMFRSSEAAVSTPEEQRKLTGLVATAYYTAEAVKVAKFQAWLAMVGVITFSMALLNILPIPPLDGWQIVIRTIRAMRGGKPLNTRLEQTLGMSGLAAMMGMVMYLTYQDILHMIT